MTNKLLTRIGLGALLTGFLLGSGIGYVQGLKSNKSEIIHRDINSDGLMDFAIINKKGYVDNWFIQTPDGFYDKTKICNQGDGMFDLCSKKDGVVYDLHFGINPRAR
jgi:hypothetical protein